MIMDPRTIPIMRAVAKNPFSVMRRYKIVEEKAGCFQEIFVEQSYYWLASKAKPNTTVVDIGAKIGETAIFFSMFPNVKKVVAYEPMPFSYSMMKKNISINPFRKKIEIHNKALSSVRESRRIDEDKIMNGLYSFTKSRGDSGGRLITSVTLADALRGLKNVIIKSDCEGAEADFFDNADLSEVYAIELEYHYCLPKVTRALKKKGFKLVINPTVPSGCGLLYAKR